ncbi:hypothetical protein HCN44_005116 [Aphidius gifuensis]|uniref:Sugar transporter SWEET1 n=1 Tax=Aphidius gifuensis TaxID=684658 RepID=A0A834XUK2_APHGI|nr:sugar transporter SWEET1-like [Aphidius gifuensis]KAF7992772.1 hypothetical protein HCN44_005116 [Aphidius gifuensis]
MVPDAFKDLLATSASIFTILQFLAGTLVCRKFVTNRTTGESSGLAFITCLMSCSFWLRYGQLKDDSYVIMVNAFGTFLQFCYIIVFTLYSVRKTLILKQFLVAVLFIIIIYSYSIIETDKELVKRQIGFLSCGLTILFFASPLTMLLHVIREKNTDSLPFPVILASFTVSSQWFIYGTIIDDQFIKVPNLIGCLLSLFQLSLFFRYRTKTLSETHLI